MRKRNTKRQQSKMVWCQHAQIEKITLAALPKTVTLNKHSQGQKMGQVTKTDASQLR